MHPDQGFPSLAAVRMLWIADAGGGPWQRSPSHRAVPEGWERKCQHEAVVHFQRTLKRVFSANREELERVEVFKYLGLLILHDDVDNQAMRSNLRKALHWCWAQVSHVLWAENATPKTYGMFYKATVQVMLLYGSET